MYQKSNNRQRSFRRGGPARPGSTQGARSFRSPRPNGHSFGGFRGRGRQQKPNSLSRNPQMFVKKAEHVVIADQPLTHASFDSFHFSEPLKRAIAHKGYTKPTPIQDQAIAPILEGRDVIGLANTGTGKTAAFLLPIIEKIYKNRQLKALIIAPTRELASQINEEFRVFKGDMKIYSTLTIGGTNLHRQIHQLRQRPNVVIGTPGRLRDLINQKVLYLNEFQIVVLDEVDMMVDIGFIHEVKYFISLLPKHRQSLFFSATLTPALNEIVQHFVTNPVTISVKSQETAGNIDQDIIKVINRDQKIEQLHELLIKDEFEKVLIFGRTKHGVEKLSRQLNQRGFKVGAIHGNKKQGNRQRTLESFKKNQIQILLATDVASRGLDIDNVTHVINYDIPETYQDYIHRIGRTGRAGKKGIALTFID